MPIEVLGQEVSIMHIGKRQLALRNKAKNHKGLVVFKRKSVPSETKYILQAQLCLAKAAIEMRGHTLEEVVRNVVMKCSGKKYLPDSVVRERKQAQYMNADTHVAEMEKKLGANQGTAQIRNVF